MNYNSTRFVISAPSIKYLPLNSNTTEVAFIGRSNSGKSSLLNKLTNQKHLARTSKNPGCTKLINLFEVIHNKYLVDLPGYGYAKTSKKNRNIWKNILIEYIKNNNNLKGLVLLVDIKTSINDFDEEIIRLANKGNIFLLILLTKADKLSLSQQKLKLVTTREILSKFIFSIQVELFSSIKGIGIDTIYQKLNVWFQK
ncbi:YihA family ribosome biogenesis GTP-binding protein [Candidatus Pantoea edessiphila]|uniref:Probable GTP-binding protein EngB n=1 Tax=Candidatus Pantoea edessiphila TaxID=2044610 RepID=A0A2P5SZQ7_9GAMM|nr:ribosome biogenesis GTP-binding protein YihA/YsxC [Candidatus Pantoea edessiphila]PPI87793.1 YihA family ribosome biogenesis GTP-binding protein [Candidatus Pantoea edessiphila]